MVFSHIPKIPLVSSNRMEEPLKKKKKKEGIS